MEILLKEFDNMYSVSDDGKIYSFKNNKKTELIGKIKEKTGYREILINHKGKRKYFLVHRLVAIAFVENPENKPMVNHKNEDGNKLNNAADNLEWATGTENNIHARNNGLQICKINQEIADKIRLDYANGGFTNRSLAKKYNLGKTHIGLIINNKRWAI